MNKPLWVIAGVLIAMLLGLIYMLVAVSQMLQGCSNMFPPPPAFP